MTARENGVGLQPGEPGLGPRPTTSPPHSRERPFARSARLQAITAALSRAVTPEDVARTLIERTLEAVAGDEGGVWAPAQDGASAVLVQGVGLGPDGAAVPLGAPAPEAVAWTIARGEPVFAASRPGAAQRGPLPALPPSGTDGAFACLPLEAEGRAIGAVSLGFRGPRTFDYDERVFLLVVARHAAQALLRARLFESERAARSEAEAARQRASFLAEASALLAASLDWEETLASVARLAVPGIADWCTVEVPETLAPGAMPVAVAHADPAKVATADALRANFPPDPRAPYGPAAVIRSGRPELWPDVPDDALVRIARSPEHLRTVRALGVRSAMVVPLSARGRTLGAITFVSAGSGRRFDAADLAMAEDLGRRAGLAVDNARLYDEAQRAIRARDDVLAVVSHDLKNPLESVVLSASLLLRDPDSPRVRRYAEAVQRSAARMDRLIRELLDASSLDAGRFRLDLRPERLAGVLEEGLALLAPLAAEKGISLGIDGDAPDVEVRCDRGRILKVLSNLVGNAVKFAPRGGQVALRVALDDRDAEVSVADDGPGIPAEDLPRLFDRYWSRSHGGTGLGLSIARGVVEAHGGRIRVESRVGEGSTFTFTIPRA